MSYAQLHVSIGSYFQRWPASTGRRRSERCSQRFIILPFAVSRARSFRGLRHLKFMIARRLSRTDRYRFLGESLRAKKRIKPLMRYLRTIPIRNQIRPACLPPRIEGGGWAFRRLGCTSAHNALSSPGRESIIQSVFLVAYILFFLSGSSAGSHVPTRRGVNHGYTINHSGLGTVRLTV